MIRVLIAILRRGLQEILVREVDGGDPSVRTLDAISLRLDSNRTERPPFQARYSSQ